MKKISASEKRLRDELCNWRESHLRLERQLEKEKQVNERNIDDLRWQNECLSKQVSALQGTLDLYIPFKACRRSKIVLYAGCSAYWSK